MSSTLFYALNIIQESRRYNQWICSFIEPYLSGVVLDIGSGLGDIASLFIRPQVDEVILSDCDEGLVERLRERKFSLQKYHVVVLDITQDEAALQFNKKRVDTITCVNVLEHIENDLAVLKRFRDMLGPGGRAVILVPAMACLYGTLDSCHGHLRRYNKEALKVKMQLAGFDIEYSRYMNFFGVFTWFLAGRVLKQKKFSVKTCYQLDKIVPLLRWLEQWFSPPWGQSLVMVGRITIADR